MKGLLKMGLTMSCNNPAFARPAIGGLVAMLLSTAAVAQGVPVVDPAKIAKEAEITAQMEADLELQRRKDDEARKQLDAEQRQREELESVKEGMTLPNGGADTYAMVSELEGEAGAADAAGSAYRAENSAAAERLFGEGRESVEQIIIRAAQDTHHLQNAGLSLIQWRCWLQALIWQESRFNPYARSPVGAYGLTQIMPGTASDLGIRGTYEHDPYVQAVGGARYLAQQLNRFGGDMILALAAYNAGPGNVQKHGGVPPFKETQNYVTVIPNKYREYMSKLGAADQIGSIEASYMANAEMAMTGGATAVYADEVMQDMRVAMTRLDAVMSRIDKTANAAEAMALNSYVRAEFARLLVMRTRLNATRSKPLTAEQIAAASAYAQERQMMNFEQEDL